MKSIISLLTLLVYPTLFAQTFTTDTVVDEDQILQQIQLDEPSEPIIRFGTETINLLGKWCYTEIDSNSFLLSAEDSLSEKNCHLISLGYWGFIQEEINKSFSVNDSVFQFHFFPENNYFTKSYFISQHNKNQFLFTYLKTDWRTVSVDQPKKKPAIELIHQFKNRTADLSLDHIFRITIDSVHYRGEVVQLLDSVITFHTYFVDGEPKDSIYRFSLDSLEEIGYYSANHPERFFQKNNKPQSKIRDNLDDFFRVIGYIGVMSNIATMISGFLGNTYKGSSVVNTGIDPTFTQIGSYSLLVSATYYSCIMLHHSLITHYYDLTEKWCIRKITR